MQQFINFTDVVASAKAAIGSSEQVAAAAPFRHTAGKSAAG